MSRKLNRKLILLLFLLLSVPTHAREMRGTVTKVHDGDAATVCNRARCESVRLMAVDAPELAQDYGKEAKQSLAARILNKQVRVYWQKRDGYGRPAGRIVINRVDLNLESLRAGNSWFWRTYAGGLSADQKKRYAEAESEARAARRGLWREDNPVPPWQFRAKKGK